AAGHHPREHLGPIGIAAHEDLPRLPRLRVRQRRRTDPHRQRPDKHARDRDVQPPATKRGNHERKACRRVEDWNQPRDADRPAGCVGDDGRGNDANRGHVFRFYVAVVSGFSRTSPWVRLKADTTGKSKSLYTVGAPSKWNTRLTLSGHGRERSEMFLVSP